MKKFIILFSIMLPFAVFAQDAAADVPGWLSSVLGLISSLPIAGPALVFVLKYMGVVAAVMTAVSGILIAVSAGMKGIASLVGASSTVDKIEAVMVKIMPYIQYLSMFNVQKK